MKTIRNKERFNLDPAVIERVNSTVVIEGRPMTHGRYLWKRKDTQDVWREVEVESNSDMLRCQIWIGGERGMMLMDDEPFPITPAPWEGYWVRLSS